MRTLKIIEHISLDGIIETGPDSPHGDWTGPYRSPAGLAMLLEMYDERCDMLLGRDSYEGFSAFWPKAPGPMAALLNAATKYVVTHRPEGLEWGPVEAVTNLIEGVRALKATEGPNLVVAGSISLTSPLIEHGLADEMILLIDPVLIGQGKRIFAEGTPPRSFTLESSRTTPTGIVINHYKFAGPLQNAK